MATTPSSPQAVIWGRTLGWVSADGRAWAPLPEPLGAHPSLPAIRAPSTVSGPGPDILCTLVIAYGKFCGGPCWVSGDAGAGDRAVNGGICCTWDAENEQYIS